MTSPAQQTSVSTRKAIGYPGMISDATPFTSDSGTSEEASAEIPLGVFVAIGTNPGGILLPTSITTDRFAGLHVSSQAMAKDQELGDTGLKPKATGTIMTEGRAYVYVEHAMTRKDKVFIRCVLGGGTRVGAIRKDADTANALEASHWVRLIDDAAGAGFVEVEFDVAGQRGTPAA